MRGSSPGVFSSFITSAAPEGVDAFCITRPSSAGSAASTADFIAASETARNLPAWLTRLWPTVLDIIANRSVAMLLSFAFTFQPGSLEHAGEQHRGQNDKASDADQGVTRSHVASGSKRDIARAAVSVPGPRSFW